MAAAVSTDPEKQAGEVKTSTNWVSEATKQFKLHDKDGNGFIDFEEMLDMVNNLWPGKNENESKSLATQFFQEFDSDRNGVLDEPEFLQFYEELILEKEVRDTQGAPPGYTPSVRFATAGSALTTVGEEQEGRTTPAVAETQVSTATRTEAQGKEETKGDDRLSKLTHGMTDEDALLATEAFKKYDKDGSGTLEMDEFEKVMEDILKKKGESPDEEELKLTTARYFSRFDIRANGTLDLSEFMVLYSEELLEKKERESYGAPPQYELIHDSEFLTAEEQEQSAEELVEAEEDIPVGDEI